MRLQSALDDLADAEEAQATGQEGGHRLLVGGVEGDRRGAAGAERGARQRQGGKPLRVGRLEGAPADGGEIEALDRRRHALRPGQGIGDRKSTRLNSRHSCATRTDTLLPYTNLFRSRVRSSNSQRPRKHRRAARKADTAASLAALRGSGAVPPAQSAARASARAGNR